MLILYVAVLFFLALVHFALRRRVAALERHYVRSAVEADSLLKQSSTRPGNSNRADLLALARQQYELAQAALKRDRAERRYLAWQSLCDRFAAFRRRLWHFQGKLMPYAAGVLDIGGLIVMLDRSGVSLEQVRAWLTLVS